jgi:hypothetical protein
MVVEIKTSNMKKNKLICIGVTGIKSCYLNVTMEEAVKRFAAESGSSEEDVWDIEPIEVIDFNDRFGAYDIWEE